MILKKEMKIYFLFGRGKKESQKKGGKLYKQEK
jgi:hypothetical protein